MLSDNFVVLIYYRNLLQNEPEMNSVNTVKFLIGIAQTQGNADHWSHRTICVRSDSLPLYNIRDIKNNGNPRTSCIIYCPLNWLQVHIISVRASFFRWINKRNPTQNDAARDSEYPRRVHDKLRLAPPARFPPAHFIIIISSGAVQRSTKIWFADFLWFCFI